MSKPTFKLDNLSKYQLIDSPGTFIVSVASTVTEKSLIDDDYPRYLVNLRVISLHNLELLIKYMENLYIVPYENVAKYFLTGAIFKDDDDVINLPIKGEKVIATFDKIDGKFLCTHIELIDRIKLAFVDTEYLNTLKNNLFKIMNKE